VVVHRGGDTIGPPPRPWVTGEFRVAELSRSIEEWEEGEATAMTVTQRRCAMKKTLCGVAHSLLRDKHHTIKDPINK
jgi:hypothetical protein